MQQLQEEGEAIRLEMEQHVETAEEVMKIADVYHRKLGMAMYQTSI